MKKPLFNFWPFNSAYKRAEQARQERETRAALAKLHERADRLMRSRKAVAGEMAREARRPLAQADYSALELRAAAASAAPRAGTTTGRRDSADGLLFSSLNPWSPLNPVFSNWEKSNDSCSATTDTSSSYDSSSSSDSSNSC